MIPRLTPCLIPPRREIRRVLHAGGPHQSALEVTAEHNICAGFSAGESEWRRSPHSPLVSPPIRCAEVAHPAWTGGSIIAHDSLRHLSKDHSSCRPMFDRMELG